MSTARKGSIVRLSKLLKRYRMKLEPREGNFQMNETGLEQMLPLLSSLEPRLANISEKRSI